MPPRRKTSALASASASSSTFPSGLYGKYKQATNFFLDWLLRARRVGVSTGATGNGKGKKKQSRLKDEGVALGVYEDIVIAIAHEPTALPPSLLQLWTRALAACETAITLRARVALFFPSTSQDGEDSHTHFLERLRSWLSTLKQAETPEITIQNARVEHNQKPLDFSNYYAVLELPDDYFPASATEDKVSRARPATHVDTKKLSEDKFENDLNVELAFLFMELEELSEAVYDAFLDVKWQKKTLVEATVVAKIAIDCAESVIAKLQLRFPSIRTGHDMMVMIADRIPFKQLSDLLVNVGVAWSPSELPSKTPQSQYVPGTIVADLMWVSRALESFAAMPITYRPNVNIVTAESTYGDTYSEEHTPHYCTPNMNAVPSFFMQQLTPLYNTLNLHRYAGIKHETDMFAGWFLDHVDRFFTTHSSSIHFVFIAICWMRSVAALQRDGGLGRTISLSIMQRWDMEERLRASIAHGEVRRADPALHKQMEGVLAYLKCLDKEDVLIRVNPLLAGFIQLDSQLQYMHIGIKSMLTTSRFRAFGHIYNALCDRQLLEPIPFIEKVVQMNERSMFTPSRAAAVHGSYTRMYYISSSWTEAAVDAMLHHRPPPPKRLATCHRDVYNFPDLSRVFRLLKKKDFSVLPIASASASWKTLLNAVSDLVTEELFDSRILSRDMLKFSDDLADVFNALCDALVRRNNADRTLAEGVPGRTHQETVNSVLTDVVVMPLILFLDCLNRDGSVRVGEDTANLLQLDSARLTLLTVGGRSAIEAYCRHAAAVISQHFAQREQADIDAVYYTFPMEPQWRSLEFGDASLYDQSQPTNRNAQVTEERFTSLMEMMQQSEGPLRAEQLTRFKIAVKQDPAVLAIVSPDPTTELRTLLHHAAAGPARDRRLVEWLMQMGALHHQPMHCRKPPSLGTLSVSGIEKSELINALAVHCAAKLGLEEMVRLLLEADHMRDLNTVTFHTRESLMHIAVKQGHRDVYHLLHESGASFLLKDASGKHIYDLTDDMSWKEHMLVVAVDQRREEKMNREQKSRDPELHRKGDAAAEKLRKDLASQREVEREKSIGSAKQGDLPSISIAAVPVVNRTGAAVAASCTPEVTPSLGGGQSVRAEVSSGASISKSKKKKKNKNKQSGSTEDQAVSQAASLMHQVILSGSNREGSVFARDLIAETEAARQRATLERTDALRCALDALKLGPKAPYAECEMNAKTALELVDTLRSNTEYLASTRGKHDMMPVLRAEVGLEASRAIFLLNKFHRQLPEKPRCVRADLWKTPPDEATLSPLEKLIRRAGPTLDTDADFVEFAVHTAEVLTFCGCLGQAKEILELVERRLLKMKQRPPVFRKCVESLVNARRKAGFEPAEGSTAEARRALEWYSNNYSGTDDGVVQLCVDHIGGYECFLKLKTVEGPGSPEFIRFSDLLDGVRFDGTNEDLKTLVYLDGCIVAGYESMDVLAHELELILTMIEQSGHHIDPDLSEIGKNSVVLKGFEFSATGIVRTMPRPD